jgi:predicted aldo/keto reductase-like oxidoreductase
MKALCGGLLTDIRACFAFFRQYENVVPIWGIQRLSELEDICGLEKVPPALDSDMLARIEKYRIELGGDFCRACGYCLPCPAGIPIPQAARMKFLLRRAPSENFLTDKWKSDMAKIENCTGCGACKARCPYGLDTPRILRMMLDDYREFAQ